MHTNLVWIMTTINWKSRCRPWHKFLFPTHTHALARTHTVYYLTSVSGDTLTTGSLENTMLLPPVSSALCSVVLGTEFTPKSDSELLQYTTL